MTEPTPIETPPLERRETLWVTDAEVIRRMGAPEKVAREAIRLLDRDQRSGFPRKQALWGNRRYWPAVKQYLDTRWGLRNPQDRKSA